MTLGIHFSVKLMGEKTTQWIRGLHINKDNILICDNGDGTSFKPEAPKKSFNGLRSAHLLDIPE